MDPLALAKKLIRIPGYAELPETETHVARALLEELGGLGLSAELQEIDGGRCNVICRYKGVSGGKKVVLCTHLDTVPPYGMPDAFEPAVRNGRLYGRGAVDVRDILAAMTWVMARLEQERPAGCGDVEFWAVAGEESGSAGMRHAVRRCAGADLAIVGEPTQLELGVAHKGVAWLQVDFSGKTAHGSVPDDGYNAVYDASLFVARLYHQLVPALEQRTHPVLGRSTVNVGRIEGGQRATIVPGECVVQIDRRLLPGESGESAAAELEELLAQVKRERPGLSARVKILLGDASTPFPPLEPLVGEAALAALCGAVGEVTGAPAKTTGLAFWTDGALASHLAGIPTVVFGPGSIAQAHSDDEYVEVAQLEAACEAYYRMIAAYSSIEKERGAGECG